MYGVPSTTTAQIGVRISRPSRVRVAMCTTSVERRYSIVRFSVMAVLRVRWGLAPAHGSPRNRDGPNGAAFRAPDESDHVDPGPQVMAAGGGPRHRDCC